VPYVYGAWDAVLTVEKRQQAIEEGVLLRVVLIGSDVAAAHAGDAALVGGEGCAVWPLAARRVARVDGGTMISEENERQTLWRCWIHL
jgi:hypothetical protein